MLLLVAIYLVKANLSSGFMLIVANWKSHKNLTSAFEWAEQLSVWHWSAEVELVIAPPTPLLWPLAKQIEKLGVNWQLATQDISPFPAGSYTGAVSWQNLEGLPIKYGIVGHSERRRYFGDTAQRVANKVDLLLQANVTPIVCLDAPDLAAQTAVLSGQQRAACVVAYEPLAAIGSGTSADINEIIQQAARIQQVFAPQAILYGGSVTSKNLPDISANCAGVLVGSASLNVDDFGALLQAAG